MARIRGYLVNLNDAITTRLPEGFNGAVAIQYGSVGNDNVTASSGTLVLEASVNFNDLNTNLVPPASNEGIGPQSVIPTNIDWISWDVKNVTAAPPTDTLTMTAAGIYIAEIIGVVAIRVRMSVAGGAHGADVCLNWQIF
jgi:hypothetical protein